MFSFSKPIVINMYPFQYLRKCKLNGVGSLHSCQFKKLGKGLGISLSLIPPHKLRHALRAYFFISVSTFVQAHVERI